MASFYEFFTSVMKGFSKHPAIIYGDRVITFKDLYEKTNLLARTMLEMGIKRDDNIGLPEYNTPEFLEIMAAAMCIAARAVPINYRFKEWELKYVIDNAEMSALFFNEDLADRIKNIRQGLKTVKNFVIIGNRREEKMLNYDDICKGKLAIPPKLPWEHFEDNDIVTIIYTGGTTGYPKGVVYRYDQLISGAIEAMATSLAAGFEELAKAPEVIWQRTQKKLHIPGVAKLMPRMLASPITRKATVFIGRVTGPFILRAPRPVITAFIKILSFITGGKVRMLQAGPLVHAWAYSNACLGIVCGFTNVFLTSRGFDPKETLETIEKWKINVLVAVGDGQCRPFVDELDQAAAEGRKYNTSSLLVVLSSGMPLSVDVKRRLLEHLPHLIIFDTLASTEGYFMTMTPYTASSTDIEKTVFKVTATTKVVNEEGQEVAPGEIGEIAIVRSHQGSSEYFKDATKSAKTFRVVGGRPMTFTGDMATVDADRRIHLIGRGSGCINTGGEKVFPEEVEEVLNKHPQVEISGITSVPHERWGQAITAVVQVKQGQTMADQEVIAWCKEHLADYKAPKYVLFVEELPRLITGKVHYREIKKMVEEKFGVDAS